MAHYISKSTKPCLPNGMVEVGQIDRVTQKLIKPKIDCTFLCWWTAAEPTNLDFMYLKLTKNNKAYCYQDPDFEEKLFEFDFTPYLCKDYYGSLCFEAEIPPTMRAALPEVNLLKSRLDLETHTKLYFGMLPNGTMGMVFSNKFNSQNYLPRYNKKY